MRKRLQVFVSSTYSDLLEERQAAVSAILKAGHIPAGMELFTAGDDSQMETIKRWIDESDVYMLILGGRYGSIEKTSGLSYTELEYNYAIELGKPVFAVVIEEKSLEQRVRERGMAVLERDKPAELKRFREIVLSRISSFFAHANDIRLATYETLHDFEKRKQFVGWVHGSEVPNVSELNARIEELESENNGLREASSGEQVRRNTEDDDFPQLAEDLLHEMVSVPDQLREDGLIPPTLPIASTFWSQRKPLIKGVDNAYNATKMAMFLFDSILPSLTIFGLAESEKVAGVQWRRYALTKRGVRLLNYFRTHPELRDRAMAPLQEYYDAADARLAQG
ncbi:MAG: hypothetical protein JWO05_1130 [Gemmatimonadetes bacterium]|nr:hypothetical protein [Gemmatimonadota bacterium]